ncbi:MAG TPA: ribosomal protein S5-alanine N-acetyltransferase [Arsenophonus nasoniae]|uniref:ribosomal protein S5-alanine N-acetyltransferase n=1 Tax=Arsenophonus nasoniae TaxID=638 RepID=UPI0038792A3F
MFGYRIREPECYFITERLIIRLACETDANRLVNYYCQNENFLKPWEPIRDSSYYQLSAWSKRLHIMAEMHRRKSAFHFLLLEKCETEVIGVINFSNVIRGAFQACYLGYSMCEIWQGKGLMYEALIPTIHFMQYQQQMHRIMANYMPHNHRSGNLLKRIGFRPEGYAKAYLQINGEWRDHILMSLITKSNQE